MTVTLYAAFLDSSKAVVKPETPALGRHQLTDAPVERWARSQGRRMCTHPTTTILGIVKSAVVSSALAGLKLAIRSTMRLGPFRFQRAQWERVGSAWVTVVTGDSCPKAFGPAGCAHTTVDGYRVVLVMAHNYADQTTRSTEDAP